MTMKAGAALLAGCALLLLVPLAVFTQEPQSVDKTVPLPQTGEASLKWEVGPVVVEDVIIRNMPDEEDLRKAESDVDDKCHPKMQVGFSNKGAAKMKVHVTLKLEGSDGAVYMSCDRNDTVAPGAVNDHTNLCWLDSMKTKDWPKVKVVRISVTASPDR
jgi:hypothetical protein